MRICNGFATGIKQITNASRGFPRSGGIVMLERRFLLLGYPPVSAAPAEPILPDPAYRREAQLFAQGALAQYRVLLRPALRRLSLRFIHPTALRSNGCIQLALSGLNFREVVRGVLLVALQALHRERAHRNRY
jgi:hypothetical protein